MHHSSSDVLFALESIVSYSVEVLGLSQSDPFASLLISIGSMRISNSSGIYRHNMTPIPKCMGVMLHYVKCVLICCALCYVIYVLCCV